MPQSRKLARNRFGVAGFLFCITLLGAVAPVRAAAPFFFIQLTDPQFGMFTDNKSFEQETANFEFAVATINRLHPAFVVVTGDLVNRTGDAAQIQECKRILAKVNADIPVYNVAGNHDVGNTPTPKLIEAYTNAFGPDHYAFHFGNFEGIVLDSNLIQAPQKVRDLAAQQKSWLAEELQGAPKSGVRHIVIFQHHPWFLKSVDEPDQYFNLPREQRTAYLPLFHQFGVEAIFCGHYHRPLTASDGDLPVVVSGALGKPLGGSQSGIEIAIVRDAGIEHRYYELGEIPTRVELERNSTVK